uniref:Uncharacterized protein n=1 Tax=Oncorhynchus kisutch TaxID=8019 RepID=A0A8C7KX27_ONCKI
MDDNNNDNARCKSSEDNHRDSPVDSGATGDVGAGGLEEVQLHLTCLPERYMMAKFTLSAYMLCWAALKLYQRLRCTPATQEVKQTQEALEDSEGLRNPEGLGLEVEDGDLGAGDSQDWSEDGGRTRDGGVDITSSEEYFDSRSWHSDTLCDTLSDLSPDSSEDSLSAILGVEDVRTGWKNSRYHTAGDCRARRTAERSQHSHSTENAETDVRGPSKEKHNQTCTETAQSQPGNTEKKQHNHRTETQHSTELHNQLSTVIHKTGVTTQHNQGKVSTEVRITEITGNQNAPTLVLHTESHKPNRSDRHKINIAQSTETFAQRNSTEETSRETRSLSSTEKQRTGFENTACTEKQSTGTKCTGICKQHSVDIQSIDLLSTLHSVEKENSQIHNRHLEQVSLASQDTSRAYGEETTNQHSSETHCIDTHNTTDTQCSDISGKHVTLCRDTPNTLKAETHCRLAHNNHSSDIHLSDTQSELIPEHPTTDTHSTETHTTETIYTDTQPTETERSSTRNTETERSSTPNTDTERSSTPNTETERSSTPNTETERSSTPYTETERSSTPNTDTERSSTPYTETERSSTPNTETERSRTPNTETERSSTPNTETERSRTPNTETERSRTPNTETERSRTPNTETERSSTPNTETERSSTPYTETERSSTPYTDTERSSTPYTETERSRTPNTDTERSSTPNTETERSSTPNTETKRSSTPNTETERSRTPNTDTERSSTPYTETHSPVPHTLETTRNVHSASPCVGILNGPVTKTQPQACLGATKLHIEACVSGVHCQEEHEVCVTNRNSAEPTEPSDTVNGICPIISSVEAGLPLEAGLTVDVGLPEEAGLPYLLDARVPIPVPDPYLSPSLDRKGINQTESQLASPVLPTGLESGGITEIQQRQQQTQHSSSQPQEKDAVQTQGLIPELQDQGGSSPETPRDSDHSPGEHEWDEAWLREGSTSVELKPGFAHPQSDTEGGIEECLPSNPYSLPHIDRSLCSDSLGSDDSEHSQLKTSDRDYRTGSTHSLSVEREEEKEEEREEEKEEEEDSYVYSQQEQAVESTSCPYSAQSNTVIAELSDCTDTVIAELSDCTDTVTAELSDRTDTVIAELSDHTDTVTAELSDHRDTVIAELSDRTDTVIAELSDRTDTVIAELSDRTDTVIAELSDRTDTVTAELSDHTDTVTAELSDHTDTVTAELSDHTDTVTAELSDHRDTVIAELSDRTDTVTAELSDRTDTVTAELSDHTDTVTAELSDHTDTVTAELSDRTDTVIAELSDRTDTVTAELSDHRDTVTAELSDHRDTVIAELSDSDHIGLPSTEETEDAIVPFSPTGVFIEITSDLLVDLSSQGVSSDIGQGSTQPTETESLQGDSTEPSALDQEATPLRRIKITVGTDSTVCNDEVQSQLKELDIHHSISGPELSLCTVPPSILPLSCLSDSNNNTKASEGSVLGSPCTRGKGPEQWSSKVEVAPQSSSEEGGDKTHDESPSLTEPSTFTSDLLGETPDSPLEYPPEDSEEFLSYLAYKHYWSSEDSAVSGLGDECHFSLAEVEELERLQGEGHGDVPYQNHTETTGCRRDTSNHTDTTGCRRDISNHTDTTGCRRDTSNHTDTTGCRRDTSNHTDTAGCRRDISDHTDTTGCRRDISNHTDTTGCRRDISDHTDTTGCRRDISNHTDTTGCRRDISKHTDTAGCGEVVEEVVYSNCAANSPSDLSEPLASYLETRGLLLDSAEKEEVQQSSPHQSPNPPSEGDRQDCSKSPGALGLEDSLFAEESSSYSSYLQTSSHPALLQQDRGVRIVRYPYSDVSLNLLSLSSLEPILEADSDRSLDNTGIVEDVTGVEVEREEEEGEEEERRQSFRMRPTEKDRDSVVLSGDIILSNSTSGLESPSLCLPEDSSSIESSEHQLDSLTFDPDDLRVMTLPYDRDHASSERRSSPTPTSVSYDFDTTSTNSEETEESILPVSGGNTNLHKPMKSNSKDSQAGRSKSSKFSVFAKMPSFRKGKSLKNAKEEDLPRDSPDLGLSRDMGGGQMGQGGDTSDDDNVFLKGDILSQTVQQPFSSGLGGRYETEQEDYSFFPSTPRTRHVRLLFRDGPGDTSLTSQPGGLRGPEGLHGYKRSKSSDSLNLRMRFAQAHKSLSSLFESRSMDKENEEEQVNIETGSEGEVGRAKQSWRRLKRERAKEAELLRRTLSVPVGDGVKGGDGEDGGVRTPRQTHSDYASRSPSVLSVPGSPSSLRALCLTDPLTKRGFQDSHSVAGENTPLGCKSEGQRRKGKVPPNGLSINFSDSGPHSSDDSEAPPTNDSSPLSPMSPASLATLANQLSWSSSRSPGGAYESTASSMAATPDTPVRPMSPKPHSPRPAAQHRPFRYPQSASSRASALSLLLMAQSASVEGLSDPPEKPKTLKPRAGPLGSSSLSPLEDSGVDSQSQISLLTPMSINQFEARARVSLSTMEEFSGIPLKAHCFSQSTPSDLTVWAGDDVPPTPVSSSFLPLHPPTPGSSYFLPLHPPTPGSSSFLPLHPPTPGSSYFLPLHPPTPGSSSFLPLHPPTPVSSSFLPLHPPTPGSSSFLPLHPPTPGSSSFPPLHPPTPVSSSFLPLHPPTPGSSSFLPLLPPTPGSSPFLPLHPPTPGSSSFLPLHPPTPGSSSFLPLHPPTPVSSSFLPLHPPTPRSSSFLPLHPPTPGSSSFLPLHPPTPGSSSFLPLHPPTPVSSSFLPLHPPTPGSSSFLPLHPPTPGSSSFLPLHPPTPGSSSFLALHPPTPVSSSFLPLHPPTLVSSSFLPLHPPTPGSSSFLPLHPPTPGSSSFLPLHPPTPGSSSFLPLHPPTPGSSSFLPLHPPTPGSSSFLPLHPPTPGSSSFLPLHPPTPGSSSFLPLHPPTPGSTAYYRTLLALSLTVPGLVP